MRKEGVKYNHRSNLIGNSGVSRNADYFSENWQQFLCFSVIFSSFNLTHRINKHNWTEEQKCNHDLIKSIHDSGLGYRKIAYYLNEKGIKTVRGNTWNNSQVFSVLKRYQEKLDREKVRELSSGIEYSTMELVWERVSV